MIQLTDNNMENIKTPYLQRPTFLTVLCILTFIGSGMNIMGSMFQLAFSSFIKDVDISTVNVSLNNLSGELPQQIIENLLDIVESFVANGTIVAMANLLLYSMSLAGAILMFQMKKTGFYIYSVAQIALLLVAPLLLCWNFFIAFGLIINASFAILFIILYFINYKHLH